MLNADVEEVARIPRLLKTPDGRVMVDPEVFVTDDMYREMWHGYRCPWCYEKLEKAFDRTCKDWCWGGRDVSEKRWHAYMDEQYGGVEWLGPTKEMVESPIWTPGSAA